GRERDVVLVEVRGQLGGAQRVEHDERLAGALEIAVEHRQLLGEEALARPGDHQHGGLDRHLVAEERDRADLVVLFLEDGTRGLRAVAWRSRSRMKRLRGSCARRKAMTWTSAGRPSRTLRPWSDSV